MLIATDLESFMRHRGLWEVEAAFARQFVSDPSSGEIVKGHAIVLAECGLATYAGTIIRDPATFEGQCHASAASRMYVLGSGSCERSSHDSATTA